MLFVDAVSFILMSHDCLIPQHKLKVANVLNVEHFRNQLVVVYSNRNDQFIVQPIIIVKMTFVQPNEKEIERAFRFLKAKIG